MRTISAPVPGPSRTGPLGSASVADDAAKRWLCVVPAGDAGDAACACAGACGCAGRGYAWVRGCVCVCVWVRRQHLGAAGARRSPRIGQSDWARTIVQ